MVMLNILVVDDEENARLGLMKLLDSVGYQVSAAANAEEAITQLYRQRFDLIISDIHMPGMNGMAFLVEISNLFPAMKVILMTAYSNMDSYLRAINLGAVEYLAKPFRLEELKAVIDRVVEVPKQP